MPIVRTFNGEEYHADIVKYDQFSFYLLDNEPAVEERKSGPWWRRISGLVLADRPHLFMILSRFAVEKVDYQETTR